jgi:hypothetical protein
MVRGTPGFEICAWVAIHFHIPMGLSYNQLHTAIYSTGNLKGKQKKRQPQVAEKTWLLKINLLRSYAAQPEIAGN